MPDYPTNVPAAGWYPDPSDPRQERWWGGVEWTHDVRPLAAALPAPTLSPALSPEPALANVPGGGINPFAAIDAHEATLSAGSGFNGRGVTTPATDFSSFNSFDTGSVSAAPTSTGVNASWYDSSRRAAPRPDPTNGLATAGLVLSLVGLNVFGIVFSILGLRKARGFEYEGDLPVGRKRSRWGLGLGIASFILSIVVLVGYLFAAQYLYSLYVEQFGGGVVQEQGDESFTPDTTPGVVDDGTYERAAYEQAIRDEYAEDGYPAPDTVTCPDSGSTAEGGIIVCEIVTGELVETRTAEYYADGNYSISTSSFSG